MLKFLFLLFPFLLLAHQSGLSYINITEDVNKHIDVLYKSPLQDINANKISINYPSYCSITHKNLQKIQNGFVINHYTMDFQKKGLLDARIWIDGLIKQNRGVLIEYKSPKRSKTALLRADKPFIYLDKKSSNLTLFISYVKLGIHHILSGYDYLLFVLSLILLARNIKVLLYAVTAFTLSHSITLACAMLGLVDLPVVFIEAMIALSILFLARELATPKEDTLTKRHLGVIAFIFGLLHGFGFSNVLKTIGLPQDEIPLSLFAFNLGIEVGQLLFILVVGFVLLLFKNFMKKEPKHIRHITAYLIGIISSFWFIQRVFSF
ncbi:HupE/UreJ family protein [Sulfurimonas sp.]|uniref:HupE/UreJ family protein n=1 Tax=Sulfurimonas sp. TaxID=2022749 RepID=UPI002602A278|nr:HupE/UreJ family protein [Sulfurimonas sp.]